MTLFLSSCEKTKIGKSHEYHMGIHYEVTSNLSFTINSLNDSRCPPGAACGVAGEVHIFITINQLNNLVDTVLYQDPTSSNPIQFGEYGFSLLDVIPISIGSTTSKDITIKLNISKI
jgi:hypothetical protein